MKILGVMIRVKTGLLYDVRYIVGISVPTAVA
jgi:hypothetical protein